MGSSYMNMDIKWKDDVDCATSIGRNKVENGSKLTAGGELSQVTLILDQHFNWFQKLMWKWCFGIKVEDYSEE